MRIIESEKFWYTLVLFALFTVIWIAFFPKMMKCGNGVCEFGENFKNCCIDCGCPYPVEECNRVTNKCEFEMKISDERILQLVNEYFRDKNMSVINAEIFAPEIYEGKKAKIVVVEVEGLNYPLSVLVTEDEEIIELPTY